MRYRAPNYPYLSNNIRDYRAEARSNKRCMLRNVLFWTHHLIHGEDKTFSIQYGLDKKHNFSFHFKYYICHFPAKD